MKPNPLAEALKQRLRLNKGGMNKPSNLQAKGPDKNKTIIVKKPRRG